MAVFSVEQNLRYFTESVGVGIAGAAFLLVGMFIGEKDGSSLKKANTVSIRYIIFGVGALAVVYLIAAPWLAIPLSEILLCATIVVVNAVKNAKNPKKITVQPL